MTIYWERCNICGRYRPVKQCTMNPDLMVCIHCCLLCPLRNVCPKLVWILDVSKKKAEAPKAVKPKAVKPKSEEAKKVLLDLLSRLEEK